MDEEIKEFCRQLIKRPFPEEHLWVGSFFELPLMYFFENITDVDSMKFDTSISVLPSIQDENKQRNFPQDISTKTMGSQNLVEFDVYFSTTREFWPERKELRIESKDSHVGFTKLRLINEDRDFKRRGMTRKKRGDGPNTLVVLILKSDLHQIFSNWSSQTSPYKEMKRKLEQNTVSCASMPNFGSESLKYVKLFGQFVSNYEDLTMDWVDCIHCQFWPKETREWICRERQNGWPPPDLIDTIINDGCFLVSKPHPNHPGDDQFRFSFSKAELNLVHSWNNVQTHIYHILRLIKKDVVKNCGGKDACHLKTYHFKTLMFWSCENNPPDFWKIDNLATSLKALLCTMIEWLKEKDCRSFFISSYNLWDYLPDDWNFGKEAQCILHAFENVHAYVDKTARLLEKLNHIKDNNDMQFLIPNKLVFILQMRVYHAHILNPLLPGRQQYGVTHAFNESDYICSKFARLYEALCRHNFVVSEKVESSLKIDIVQEILSNLKQFRKVSFEGMAELRISSSYNGHEFIQKILDTPFSNKEQNCEFKPCTNDDVLMVMGRPILQWLIEHLNGVIDNPFLILSYAYEANFHYTGFVDCSDFKEHCHEALKLCDEGLKLCRELESKPTFWIAVTPELLPVILTKKWLNIFDKHIAAALKSYFVSTEEFENSKFVIHFSPKHILKYVRLQCMRILGYAFDDEREMESVRNNNDPNPSRDILCRALANSRS